MCFKCEPVTPDTPVYIILSTGWARCKECGRGFTLNEPTIINNVFTETKEEEPKNV